MLIYKKDNTTYVYIHIPKNSGKYIRKKIETDKTCRIIKSYWGIKDGLDLAHIPYVLRSNFTDDKIDYKFFAYTRNPYSRVISAYFYKYPKKKFADFKTFVKNELINYKFDLSFNRNTIHFCPQYLFVCDNEDKITNVEVTKLEDIECSRAYKHEDYYNDDTFAIVNKIYEKDFELFNYSRKSGKP